MPKCTPAFGQVLNVLADSAVHKPQELKQDQLATVPTLARSKAVISTLFFLFLKQLLRTNRDQPLQDDSTEWADEEALENYNPHFDAIHTVLAKICGFAPRSPKDDSHFLEALRVHLIASGPSQRTQKVRLLSLLIASDTPHQMTLTMLTLVAALGNADAWRTLRLPLSVCTGTINLDAVHRQALTRT